MKKEENKGLHSMGKKVIPSANGKPSIDDNNQDNDSGANLESGDDPEDEDMGHIKDMVDSMNDKEASHAHKHLTERLKPNKLVKPVGEDVNDFANAMGEQS